MTWKDKLEIGLKDDAPFRRDNLPDSQKVAGGPATQPGDPTRSPEEPGAREFANAASGIDAPAGQAQLPNPAPACTVAQPAPRVARKRRPA